MHKPQVLICDDDSVFQLSVKHVLKGKYECKTAYNTDEALAILRNQSVDILLLDIQMRSPTEGLEAIPKFLELEPELSIAMISAITDSTVREALVLGASDYFGKDMEPDALVLAIEKLMEDVACSSVRISKTLRWPRDSAGTSWSAESEHEQPKEGCGKAEG